MAYSPTLSRVSSQTISILPVDPNGPEVKLLMAELRASLKPFTTDLKGPNLGGSPDSARPGTLPEGSIYIVAELSSFSRDAIELDHQYCGGIGLVPHQHGAARSKGLPTEKVKVGEVKRAIVTEKFRGKGIGSRLLRALEETARNEGFGLLVVETLSGMEDASRFYEQHGYRRRELFGLYVQEDSKCFEKSLKE